MLCRGGGVESFPNTPGNIQKRRFVAGGDGPQSAPQPARGPTKQQDLGDEIGSGRHGSATLPNHNVIEDDELRRDKLLKLRKPVDGGPQKGAQSSFSLMRSPLPRKLAVIRPWRELRWSTLWEVEPGVQKVQAVPRALE